MNETIRVAMIIQGYHPCVGGAEKQLGFLNPLLTELGCEVHVLTRRYPGFSPEEIIEGVRVHRLPIPGPKAVASASFTLSALPLLQKISPDVIHAHELLSPTTTAIAAKRLFGIPVVAKVLRGGILGDLAKLRKKSFGMRRIELYKKYVDAFITISSEIDNELHEAGVPAEKRPFVPNGVDTARFSPVTPIYKEGLKSMLGLPPGPLVIFTGRLAPEKRLDLLLDVWSSVRNVHPEANLVLLGTGESEESLKQREVSGVYFPGNVEDVAPYLQAADVFVLPSETEGLSNALLEAMSVSVAVLATSVGGAPDLIEHLQNGWLIPVNRPDSLKAGLICLLEDRELRLTIGRNAREQVMRNYSLPAIAGKLRQIYETVSQKKIVERAAATLP